MGANSSSLSELSTNEYLCRLAGTEVIGKNDPFWNQLLSFSFTTPRDSADARLLEESTINICKTFAINNCRTGNLGSLVRVFLARATELKASAQCEDNIFTWQTYNALFIIRSISKYFIEHLSEEVIIQQFETKSQEPNDVGSDGQSSCLEELMNCLIELIVDVPVVDLTYLLHMEALNTLLVLLAIQMFQPQPASNCVVYRALMQGKCSIHACILVKTLLLNFIRQDKYPVKNHHGGGSMLYGIGSAVASGLWSVMTLGMGGKAKNPEEEPHDDVPLADQSVLLILVLANHCTSDTDVHNPYRQALFSFTNSQDIAPNTSPSAVYATFKLDFSKLYNALCHNMKDDQTTLMLYLLLHRNSNIKAYVLSRVNLEQLIIPILKILYSAQERNSHHIYMALIILLILSEDDFFNKAVHEILLKNVLWFKERAMSEVTLGGLLVLVVIRTIQYNMTRMRDKYLHTNCLAALANMSSQFHNLHPYVTQRIVSLLGHLSKKHTRLIEQIRVSATEPSNHESEESEGSEVDYVQDLAVLEEVIRMVLEIINSCLCNNLNHNPNLIYTLLYQKDLFTAFRTHPTFQDIIQNIDTVLAYFTTRLQQHDKDLSVHEVLEEVTLGANQFKKERLKKFPELKFKYVEEDQPEEFFIPYVWSLVYHSSNLYFLANRIQLFTLQTEQEAS